MKTQRETKSNIVKEMIPFIDEKLTINSTILEPSAGSGNLVKGILFLTGKEIFKNSFYCVELNQEKLQILRESGFDARLGDFLSLNLHKQFDMVVACPPFKNNVDVLHIAKMYKDLKKGGRIVTLTSPKWITGNEDHQSDFRQFLNDKNYFIKMLPDYSFVEKHKTIPTAILVIDK